MNTLPKLLNLLRSMRFAIAILCVVAVAATIGSILEQNQPTVVYVSRYGQFWAGFYALCGLTDVYHAWWFFVLLGFMAASTALCLWQRTPAMLRDMRSYNERKSVASLRQLEYSAAWPLPQPAAPLAESLGAYLKERGYRWLRKDGDAAVLLAARKGSGRRLGYLLVHGAMVLICVGGLIDGNVLLRLQLWSGALRIETRDLPPAQVPAASRLAADAGSFRASMNLPEGDTGATALLPMGDGYLLQELPFQLRLKRFRIEHYANGQPSDFASDIEILDGGQVLPVTLQVNRPYTHRGVTLFQSGFADGGSSTALTVTAPGGGAPQRIEAKVGASAPLLLDGRPYTLEVDDLRAINVFNRDDAPLAPGWHSRAKPGERVHDVGPSLAFRLRDSQGQAEEWLAYQRPVEIDGASWFLFGRRGAQDSEMQYQRLPADANGSLDSYHRLTGALARPQARREAAQALAARSADTEVAAALATGANALLDGFAARGYRSLAELVPPAGSQEQQMKGARFYLDLLERAAGQLAPDLPPALVRASLASYSETLEAKLPALVQFNSYRQVNASGIQLTRAPGASLVYLGAALLSLGVIAMYFIPERRLWLRLAGGELLLAFAANRPSPALQAEFDGHRDAIRQLTLSDR